MMHRNRRLHQGFTVIGDHRDDKTKRPVENLAKLNGHLSEVPRQG